MQLPLAFTTLFMGLAGGPHCIAMCGAACAGLRKGQGGVYGLWKFQAGRLIGYTSLGAIAAGSVKSLAWFSSQTVALHPLWTFFFVFVPSEGLVLLINAHQPTRANNLARPIRRQGRQLSDMPGGIVVTGMLWAFMPCSLLYSALLVASLNANAVNGALSMATFAMGTSVSLMLGPWLWLKLKNSSQWINEGTSMRLAGLLLSVAAAWAIWMDLVHQVNVWCN